LHPALRQNGVGINDACIARMIDTGSNESEPARSGFAEVGP
jgi:hypothetical protein